MASDTAPVGILTVELHIPDSQSLKSKRRILLSLKDRLKSRFNISVAEIGDLDKWQTATLGICMIANDQKYVEAGLQKILNFIEDFDGARIMRQSVEFL